MTTLFDRLKNDEDLCSLRRLEGRIVKVVKEKKSIEQYELKRLIGSSVNLETGEKSFDEFFDALNNLLNEGILQHRNGEIVWS